MTSKPDAKLKDENMQDQEAREIRADLSRLTEKMHEQHVETIKTIGKLATENKVNAVKIGGFVTLLTMAVASVVSFIMLRVLGS